MGTHKIYNKGQKRLFDNSFLERLTRTHISLPLTIFTLYSAVLVYWGIVESGLSILMTATLFISGFLSFTLIEYIMHRWVFHIVPTTPARERFAYKVHGVHHEYPKDKYRLAMPIPLSLFLATLFLGIYYLIMGQFTFGFTPGFLMGYTAYLSVHYSVHAFQPPKNFMKILWVHHGIHHYKRPDKAFGVSSPLWDVVFRTMP